MNRKFWQLGFFMIVLTLANVTEVQGQLWNRVKKHFAFAEEYDENIKFKIGIYLGGINSNYVFDKNEEWYNEGMPAGDIPDIGIFSAINSIAGPGFSLGIPFDYRFTPHLNLSITPGVLIGTQHKLRFEGVGGAEQSTNRFHQQSGINFPVFELPMHLKIRSEKKYLGHNSNPYTLYLLGGTKYSNLLGVEGYYNTTRTTGPDFDPNKPDQPIIVKPDYFSYEFGLGLDMYFTYFKFSPEIRFSQSLGNLMDKNRTFPTAPGYQNPFMNAIDRLSLRSLQISLIFE